ncbi:uncharacterized protein LOC115397387 isoform X1 [Salarias fasciatus]|uniref:uncharacterized protein LOC115397387 isoform X1 n=2 Tax=Salarias fasciatus TaxID=181472 RepID=UPI001176CE3D|nr:uncharacterized protein LOC115397387 isoform X1 [Salarias fasciatus]
MFHFIWVALLLTVAETKQGNDEKSCLTLSDRKLTAEAELCAVVPCLTGANSDVSVTWHKSDQHCDKTGNKDNTNNCRIIMKDLSQLDRGSYLLKISEISQKPTVESSLLRAGHHATLTCTVLGLSDKPVSSIDWTWSAAGGNISTIEGTDNPAKTENLTGKAQRHNSTLTFKATAEHHGTNVTCTVNFGDGSTAEENKTLSVSSFSGILNASACQRQSGVLTCVCVSEGFPLPTITWPQLEKRTDYSVLTTVSNNTVNNTVTVSEKTNSHATFQCVSSNGANEVRRDITVTESEAQQKVPDLLAELWRIIKQLEVIVAFLIGLLFGIIFSSFLTCLARKCRRQKLKPGRLTEDLEMNTHAVQMEVCHAAEDEGTEEAGMMAAGPSAPEGDVRPKEVEYSHIDFSLLKAKNPAEEDSTQGATETEYAEIKKEIREEGEGNDGEGSEEMREDERTTEDGGEQDTLYSNVKEIMDE